MMGKMTRKENTHPIIKLKKIFTQYEWEVIGDKRAWSQGYDPRASRSKIVS